MLGWDPCFPFQYDSIWNFIIGKINPISISVAQLSRSKPDDNALQETPFPDLGGSSFSFIFGWCPLMVIEFQLRYHCLLVNITWDFHLSLTFEILSVRQLLRLRCVSFDCVLPENRTENMLQFVLVIDCVFPSYYLNIVRLPFDIWT